MATNQSFDEKPNSRPTKRVTANGKTLFLHHNLNQTSTKSYIRAEWHNLSKHKSLSDEDLFGIDGMHIAYSLNKRRRWNLLLNAQQHLHYFSDPEPVSESDDERSARQHRRKRRAHRQNHEEQEKIKFRLYQTENIGYQANCVGIMDNTKNNVQLPKKTYMALPKNIQSRRQDNEPAEAVQNDSVDVTYYASLPASNDKYIANVRRKTVPREYRKKYSKRPNLTRLHGDAAVESHSPSKVPAIEGDYDIDEDDDSDDDDDDRDWTDEIFYGTRPDNLKLTDFIPTIPKSIPIEKTKRVTENLVAADRIHPKSSRFYLDDLEKTQGKHLYHRQISKEEKLYKRDLVAFRNNTTTPTTTVFQPTQKLMSFSFRSVFVEKNELRPNALREKFGKDFINAHCFPKKYLIRLSDRLKSMKFPDKPESFKSYVNLNAYLILVENDTPKEDEHIQRIQVALNMDLFCGSIEIETLMESTSMIYKISEIIERSLSFISTLAFDLFKPLDAELVRKRIVRTTIDQDLSDSEHLNKQLAQLKLMDRKPTHTEMSNIENLQFSETSSIDEFEFTRPDTCTICYRNLDSTISVTALQTCAHWLCDDCWKSYLETSVKRIELIRCPEWNCDSIVDTGTLLSLANVRCMNIYERNIENCLVNVSRSYIKCPANNCVNIVPIIGIPFDHVRCSCGHEFCIQCKQEPHFPATCRAFRFYMEEVHKNGDGIIVATPITHITGRNCVSCNNFIEKNGGCNHMTCRCGAEFCWSCSAYWKDHYNSDGEFKCPQSTIPLQQERIHREKSNAKRFYYDAVHHRHERILLSQVKFRENAIRLLSTIPVEKVVQFDVTVIEKQVYERESLLRHLLEMGKYIQYLHRICEFVAVAADGYGNSPGEHKNSLQPLENLLLNMSQVFEGGRGHQAIQQINECHSKAEKIIERLQHAVRIREIRRAKTTGYVTS